jgi:hypothetical protein
MCGLTRWPSQFTPPRSPGGTSDHVRGQLPLVADITAAGYQARRLALAVVGTQIDSGHDVYVGQFLAIEICTELNTQDVRTLACASRRAGG